MPVSSYQDNGIVANNSSLNIYKRDRSSSNNNLRPPKNPQYLSQNYRGAAISSTTQSHASIIAEMHYQRGMSDIKQDL